MAHDARGRGAKVLWITHDLAQARRLADDIVFLHQGRITERTSAETFFARPESPEARAFIAGYIEPESAA
jgi:tungstate transport system ATP-binding protein